jgi:hypothetical protein
MNIEEIKTRIVESYKISVDSGSVGRISYSQYSKYAKCPRSWELAYKENLRTRDPSIHTLFGTSFHETLQEYLGLYMNNSTTTSTGYDYKNRLKTFMVENYTKDVSGIEHFTTPEELNDFWEDGVNIMDELIPNIYSYYDKKRYDLLGVEVPLYMKATELDFDVNMLAYVDIVLYDKLTSSIVLVDIKTSFKGWNKYMRNDVLKQSQLLFYKYYFSKQYGVPYESINVKFMIVTRKLEYGTSRIAMCSIPETANDVDNSLKNLTDFVENSFEKDGSYKENIIYHAISGDRNKNCKYCEFKDREDLCPKKSRIK